MHKIIKAGIGITLVVLGLIVISGWILHSPIMVQFRIGFVPMQFNTALCFVLTGVGLAAPALTNQALSNFQRAIGGVLITLCSLTLLEILFGLNLGIDWPSLHTWLGDGNIQPGRMAPNTALGFVLIGCAFIQLSRITTKNQARCGQLLTVGVLAIGLTGLVGYLLGPDLLFGWARSARMAIPTAIGMILTGTALWLSWINSEWYRSQHYFKDDEKISFLGSAIVTVAVLTAGLVGFVSLEIVLQKFLHHQIQRTFDQHKHLFREKTELAVGDVNTIAKSKELIQLLVHLQTNPHHQLSELPTGIIEGLTEGNFVGAILRDATGAELLRVGNPTVSAKFSTELSTSSPSTLLWNENLRLQSFAPVLSGNEHLGTLFIEQSLVSLYQHLFDASALGATGEVTMCIDKSVYLLCLPYGNGPDPYSVKPFSSYGKPLPMKLALQGESGVGETIDYRGKNVVAAYSLLAPRLGMVNKQDSFEVYRNIREQLQIVIPLMLFIAAVGAALLRSQVRPLARKLMRSEATSAEKEQQISTLLSSVGEAIITIDDDGHIDTFNPAASQIFGYSLEDVRGKNVKILMPSNMHEPHDTGMHRYVHGGAAHILGQRNVEVPGLRSDGSLILLELTISEVKTNNRRLFVGIMRDITDRKKNELELFEEKERLHVTLNSIGDAVITTDTQGLVTSLNPVAELMTGWTNDEAKGRPILEVFHIVDEKTSDLAFNPVDAVLTSQANAGLAENTILIQRHSGIQFPIEDSAAPIRNKNGDVIGVVLVFHDVSQAKKMAEEMTYQATHDSLTGLINRREFERRIELSLKTGKIQQKDHTLLYLDLDQFKIVNDTCGHSAGDQLLRQLTSVLRLKLRQTDTLARLGGDEFGVLLDSCPTAAALKIAEILRLTVSDFHFVWGNKTFCIGVTIGLVTFSNDDLTLTDVLKMADSACYVAKEKGRNRVQVYLPETQEFASRHGQMDWVTRIQLALEENRFVLYSQQLLALGQDHSKVTHHELLIRMKDELGTLVPPMAFIPAAERYGLMKQIDRWVVSSAFACSAALNVDPEHRHVLAINLSGTTLSDELFLPYVREQFEKYDVAPANFCFEITETAAIANLAHAVKLIKELQTMGCLFALDDFGSGMSSFTYLKHLPVNFLKIDGSFVRDMVANPIDRAMVESINNIGHVMGIQTIAEFVENQDILNLLRQIKVDFAQGYLIQKPEPLFDEHGLKQLFHPRSDS